jgi:hypothetical protein
MEQPPETGQTEKLTYSPDVAKKVKKAVKLYAKALAKARELSDLPPDQVLEGFTALAELESKRQNDLRQAREDNLAGVEKTLEALAEVPDIDATPYWDQQTGIMKAEEALWLGLRNQGNSEASVGEQVWQHKQALKERGQAPPSW